MFEGLKRIDNNFWKRQQEERHKFQAARAVQGYTPKAPRPTQERPSPTLESPALTDKLPRDCTWRSLSQVPSSSRPKQPLFSTSSILGPDGRLIPTERQRRMSLGLCMCCGQSSHLARSCPKQVYWSSGVIEARASFIDQSVCHKLHLAISPSILHRFSQSQWLRKALEKTFRSVPVTSWGDQ